MTQRPSEHKPQRRAPYGVKLVRGPILKLGAHADHVDSTEQFIALCRQLRSSSPNRLLAADLFSGAGGMSLGLRNAGMDVVLGVDHYPEAVETHSHHFSGMSVAWDLGDAEVIEQVARLIRAAGVEVIVGGPPCQPFSKAGRSGIRYRVRHGQRDPHDERRDLWRSFLEIVRLAKPRAVVIENVPDMALDREMFILRSIVHELEELGYGVEERVVETWRYGVPQFRQRLIVVALAHRIRFDWPAEAEERVTVGNAIGELPEVDGGWRPEGGADGWMSYDGPVTPFQEAMRFGVPEGQEYRLYDHITRPVREDDARAFERMDSTTRYSDLPEDMKRYRDDIFDDKYKRLDEDNLSRTITAHIAKDGYWYIHPRQGRTLTVREAARLQTFPDWFRFAGGPSAAFKQIGNAVPPRLAEAIGRSVRSGLDRSEPLPYTTGQVADALASWFEDLGDRLWVPWLKAATRWQVIVAATLLDRSSPEHIRTVWPVLRLWDTPAKTLEHASVLGTIGDLIGRSSRANAILEIARAVADDPDVLDQDDALGSMAGLNRATAELAVLAVSSGGEDQAEEPVIATQAVLRVASRFFAEPVHLRNKLTDGRLAIARMIGGASSARGAHLGLIELAASLCRPTAPECGPCPLLARCRSAERRAALWDLSEDVASEPVES